jgi:hypothetical protein
MGRTQAQPDRIERPKNPSVTALAVADPAPQPAATRPSSQPSPSHSAPMYSNACPNQVALKTMCHNFRKCPRSGPPRQPPCEKKGGKKEGDDWVSASPSQKAAPPPQSVQPHLAREVGGRSRRRLRLQPFTHPAITGRSIRSTRRRFRKVRFLAAPLLSFTGWERVWISFFFCGISGWRSPEELGSSPCSLGLSGHAPLVYQNPRHFLTTFFPL